MFFAISKQPVLGLVDQERCSICLGSLFKLKELVKVLDKDRHGDLVREADLEHGDQSLNVLNVSIDDPSNCITINLVSDDTDPGHNNSLHAVKLSNHHQGTRAPSQPGLSLEQLSALPCGHVFHKPCLVLLEKSSASTISPKNNGHSLTCPLCRLSISSFLTPIDLFIGTGGSSSNADSAKNFGQRLQSLEQALANSKSQIVSTENTLSIQNKLNVNLEKENHKLKSVISKLKKRVLHDESIKYRLDQLEKVNEVKQTVQILEERKRTKNLSMAGDIKEGNMESIQDESKIFGNVLDEEEFMQRLNAPLPVEKLEVWQAECLLHFTRAKELEDTLRQRTLTFQAQERELFHIRRELDVYKRRPFKASLVLGATAPEVPFEAANALPSPLLQKSLLFPQIEDPVDKGKILNLYEDHKTVPDGLTRLTVVELNQNIQKHTRKSPERHACEPLSSSVPLLRRPLQPKKRLFVVPDGIGGTFRTLSSRRSCSDNKLSDNLFLL